MRDEIKKETDTRLEFEALLSQYNLTEKQLDSSSQKQIDTFNNELTEKELKRIVLSKRVRRSWNRTPRPQQRYFSTYIERPKSHFSTQKKAVEEESEFDDDFKIDDGKTQL